MHVLIVGCGYVGEKFANQALAKGWRVSALTRSSQRAALWEPMGITPVVGDVLDPDSLRGLPAADLCLYAVGFDRSAGVDKREVYVKGLRNVLSVIAGQIPRLIYISSTSVYGESAGNWVTEETPCNPHQESGQICLSAEECVREFYSSGQQDHIATVLRLSGIYGPGRLIGRKEQLAQQLPIAGNPQSWLNLIHVDDILQTVFLLAEAEAPAPLYLLSDAQPLRRIEFYTALAQQLGTSNPIMPDPACLDLGKRCDSRRIRDDLDLQLRHPTIQTGLAASLDELEAK